MPRSSSAFLRTDRTSRNSVIADPTKTRSCLFFISVMSWDNPITLRLEPDGLTFFHDDTHIVGARRHPSARPTIITFVNAGYYLPCRAPISFRRSCLGGCRLVEGRRSRSLVVNISGGKAVTG